jgi:gliding motility-associated-like protein
MKTVFSHLTLTLATTLALLLASRPVTAQVANRGDGGNLPGSSLLVANVFTPNADGINDVFIPAQGVLSDYTIRIYNRSGQEVFKGNASRHWDGYLDGRPLPAGIYIYSLQGTLTNGEYVRRSGSVTLIR